MRQKLKQYLSLVEEASKDQRPTTSDDLQVSGGGVLDLIIVASARLTRTLICRVFKLA